MKWKITEPKDEHIFGGHKMQVRVGDFATTTPILTSYSGQEGAKEVFRLYHQMLEGTPDPSVILKPESEVIVSEDKEIFFRGCLSKALKWSKPKD
jgi:hypothetical protein